MSNSLLRGIAALVAGVLVIVFFVGRQIVRTESVMEMSQEVARIQRGEEPSDPGRGGVWAQGPPPALGEEARIGPPTSPYSSSSRALLGTMYMVPFLAVFLIPTAIFYHVLSEIGGRTIRTFHWAAVGAVLVPTTLNLVKASITRPGVPVLFAATGMAFAALATLLVLSAVWLAAWGALRIWRVLKQPALVPAE